MVGIPNQELLVRHIIVLILDPIIILILVPLTIPIDVSSMGIMEGHSTVVARTA